MFRSFLHTCTPYLHSGGLLAATNGVVLKAELVLTDHSPAVFVANVGDHVHVWGPQLKLTLPVDDCGQRGAHQERSLRVTLDVERTEEVTLSDNSRVSAKLTKGNVENMQMFSNSRAEVTTIGSQQATRHQSQVSPVGGRSASMLAQGQN